MCADSVFCNWLVGSMLEVEFDKNFATYFPLPKEECCE